MKFEVQVYAYTVVQPMAKKHD